MKKAKKVKPAKKVKTAEKAKKMDLGAVFDAHVRHEFVDHDVAATMKTMAAEPYVHNVPTLTGGDGHAGVVEFYTQHFVGKMPADTRVEQISRTVGKDQVVDELILYFTHDCPIDFMLPGIPPTGRKVALPHVVVMKFKGDKVAHEHIYWDQACVLAQIGLLDPSKLPVTGAGKPRCLLKNRGASERERLSRRSFRRVRSNRKTVDATRARPPTRWNKIGDASHISCCIDSPTALLDNCDPMIHCALGA